MRIYYISYIVTGQNVALVGHMVVVCKSLLTVCVPCGDVYHLWEKDQDYDFVVIDL